ncbi:NAD-glutamate dehydrogenase [Glaciecola petra]|uniref:NAD-glutamate dehydrogenase n=1 Tax=Glaciecola petra TaxID=3075602 RepID=A0ABU2ZNN6_9ALTE|nr:NAD-glutamate dehydrogenase [Aestuariibacter sp. P117]MDT0594220.1 NAD-glutamate dehydrogenase [Aestuariibacter sp. P117]
MSLTHHQQSVLLERVFSLVNDKVDPSQSDKVIQFGQLLMKTMSFDDLDGRSDSDLYGAILSLWQLLQDRETSEPSIKVFNPEIAKNGWQSSHTVIEIIVDDMPFLVDSIRMAINRMNITSHLILHTPMHFIRSKDGNVSEFTEKESTKAGYTSETVFFIEIDRQSRLRDLGKITEELRSVVSEVSLSVADWQPMREKLKDITKSFVKSKSKATASVKSQGKTFLNWLNDHNFTLMGYRYYDVKAVEGDHRWCPNNDSSLGLMKNSISNRERLLSNVPANAREMALSSNPLLLTKTNSQSRVHRPAYMDYIGIKEFDDKGNVSGEHRFVGLYSASFYNSSAADLPMLREKIDRMCQLSGFEKGTHAYKAFVNIVETYPRDELIQTTDEDLAQIIMGIFQMQERGMSRLFVRKDTFGRYFSCMVYVPRERYNTQLRRETQDLLKRSFKAEGEVEFNTYFSESVYARTHYIARVNNNNLEFDVNEIEKNLIELTKTWQDKLNSKIVSVYGEEHGKTIVRKYDNAFSRSYSEQNLPSAALVDIQRIELLNDENKLDILFYKPQEQSSDSDVVKLKLYHKDEPIHLSDVLPMLENFGIRVVDESPYKVTNEQGQISWVMDFTMLYKGSAHLDMDKAQELFQNAFSETWLGNLEDDGFNRLILGAGITGRRVTIVRAYAKYMRQIGSSFSLSYVANTMASYPDISKLLIELFNQQFCPSIRRNKTAVDRLQETILQKLDTVSNLDDDRIIRRYLDLINATLRTNFYQKDEEGQIKPYISFKMLPAEIPEMPLPLPKFEIFVYSPRIEGVHLRGGKVARGGLRWSDRMEDFRTEILGLVKAQQVKNTVIVPVGAKGGFVCKRMPDNADRATMQKEGQACYKIFIRSLLDITDNIVDGKVIPPTDVVRLDEDDPYLVVAADKGTATFSDIANGISDEFNFWLGDAFASGGSVGYDHKKMGITARGAWESVKRHFREIGVDCQTTPFTCVAIGDMSGDVFGNGMLLSTQTKIVCAFNHMHIFFDPTPNVEKTYKERQRLFEDPTLSWDDYDRKLISKGGGIFKRSEKSIKLSPEMKKALGVNKATMTPTELIHNVLKMPVDLIWNGGIGTYIKGSKESHAEVGDRANDTLRVNGKDVKAKIVGEGGNLGLTQLGRIEYAANGGHVNTDFIDNVGGVDCSDNEVNIKILLNTLVNNGDLTLKQRNALLYDMTDDVGDIVIQDCYRQTQSISITEMMGVKQLKEQLRFIHGLEREGALNRELEFIPSDDEISERVATGQGLTRPELSVLIAYGKMVMKEEFNLESITGNAYYNKYLLNAFPAVLREKYSEQMQLHPLRSEIIATKLTNEVINDMGLNFVHRLREETGADASEICNAYSIVKAIFKMGELWEEVEQLDNIIDAKLQLEILDEMRRTLRRTVRWYIRHGEKDLPIDDAIAKYAGAFNTIANKLTQYLVASEVKEVEQRINFLVQAQVPEVQAIKIACMSNLFSSLDLAQVAELEKRPVEIVARLYFQLGNKFELHWFLQQINHQTVANHWQALARASYREELDWQQRAITTVLLNSAPKSKDADAILASWIEDNQAKLSRWHHMMTEFKTSENHEFAKFSVALRELMLLSISANH